MRYSRHISNFLLTFVLIFIVGGFVLPKTVSADYCIVSGVIDPSIQDRGACDEASGFFKTGTPPAASAPSTECSWGNLTACFNPANWAAKAFGILVYIVLQFVGLLLALSGLILNGVIYYTVGKMSANYTGLTTIGTAWSTIRDVANMGFIFVLLYAAIQTILGIGDDNKKLIVRMIVVAILINFSLFFTKVVIDASNILAILFYDAIAPGALSAVDLASALTKSGMSNAFMNAMNLQSLFNVTDLPQIPAIITVGLMGSIMILIATFVFFAAAIMFIIRYVVLILVIILSPIAFIASILPQLKKYQTQWWSALSGQAFFAPIFFMLIWISLRVLDGIGTSLRGGGPVSAKNALAGIVADSTGKVNLSGGAFAMFINFMVVIVFLVVALITAKEWANKAGGGVSKLTGWATGAAGGATLGVAGRFGRNTVGRAGAAMGDSEKLKERAAKGGMGGMAARLALATGKRTGGASFDVRGSALGGTLGGGSAQKGGFFEARKQKAEAEAKFAGSLAPSAKTESKTKTEYEDAVKKFGDKSPQALEAKIKRDNLLGNKTEIDSKVTSVEQEKQKEIAKIKDSEELKSAEVKEKSASDIVARLTAEAGAAEGAVKEEKMRELETAKLALVDIKKEAGAARQKVREEIEAITPGFDARKEALRGTEVLKASEARKENFAKAVEKSFIAKYVRGYNYEAAAQIRKGKSNKDKLAEAAAAFAKETAEAEAPPEAPTVAAPITPPAPPSPTPPTPPTP